MQKACKENRRDLIDLMILNNDLNLNEGLRYSAEANNKEFIKLMISKGARDMSKIFIGACAGGHLELAKSYEGCYDYDVFDKALVYACKSDNKDLVEYILSIIYFVYNHSENAFNIACQRGNIEIINFLINDGYYNYNNGLEGACEGGHNEVIKIMITLGATDYNGGLVGACRGGHNDIIKIMIDLGATDYNGGLVGACRGGHIEIVNLMISLGANEYNLGLENASRGGHIEIVKLMISLGATNYTGGLIYAVFNHDIEIVKMMIELGENSFNEILEYTENIDIAKLAIKNGATYIDNLLFGNLEFKILYCKVSKKNIELPIKTQHLEYHLLNVYNKRIPDIDRLINKYLY